MPLAQIIESINGGFGGTIGHIGIVIICGTIIGTFLEHSGGAFAMAEKILKVIGEKHVPLAMTIIGYFVSIPYECNVMYEIRKIVDNTNARRFSLL